MGEDEIFKLENKQEGREKPYKRKKEETDLLKNARQCCCCSCV